MPGISRAVVAPDGNVLGTPATIGLDLTRLPAAARDGRLRAAISTIVATAARHSPRAIVIEDLDFARGAEGRERHGTRPTRPAGTRISQGGRGHPHREAPRPPGADDLQRRTTVVVVDPAYS